MVNVMEQVVDCCLL